MSGRDRYRILVLSSRPDMLAAVRQSAAGLDPEPDVTGLYGASLEVNPDDLLLVDIAEPRATAPYLRRRFGEGPSLVALVEGAWVGRLGDALAGDWDDYLFYPLNLDELGLVWRRHAAREETPQLSLDVDEEGTLRVVIPSAVTHRRPLVERVVEASRHLAGFDSETAFRLRVALGEAVSNAILYGSGEESGRVVRVEASVESEGLRVSVEDEGEGFDPAAVPDPTARDGLQRSHGRGLFLLRQLSDRVAFNDVGNRVTLWFRGALDPLRRVEPWLGPFSGVSGLRFRLERLDEGGTETLYDAWEEPDDGGADDRATAAPLPGDVRVEDGVPGDGGGGLRVRSIGRTPRLKLTYGGHTRQGGDAEPAAEVLGGWLGAVVEGEELRESLLERRMRRARVLAELEVARDLQLRLLPDPASFADLARVAARCDPALSLGGDFYYLTRLPGPRLGFMLGDVSSHGPSAALIMALTLSAAAVATGAEPEPAAALDAMHGQLLAALASTEMYMTLFYGVLDPARRHLAFANAGHPYAYRLSGGTAERLAALDPPIGMGEASDHSQTEIALAPDDVLLAFTDGLVELRDPFGEGDGPAALVGEGSVEPERLVEALFAASDDEMRLDDRTAVAVGL